MNKTGCRCTSRIETGCVSWKLRDHDNLLVARLESQLLRSRAASVPGNRLMQLISSARAKGLLSRGRQRVNPGCIRSFGASVRRATSSPPRTDSRRNSATKPASPATEILGNDVRPRRALAMAANATAGSPIIQALVWPPAMTYHSNASIAVFARKPGTIATELDAL